MLIQEHLHCDLAIIDLEGQDHILIPMLDYVGLHVKIISPVGLPIVKLLAVVYFTNYDQVQSFAEIFTYLKHIVLVNSRRLPVTNGPI